MTLDLKIETIWIDRIMLNRNHTFLADIFLCKACISYVWVGKIEHIIFKLVTLWRWRFRIRTIHLVSPATLTEVYFRNFSSWKMVEFLTSRVCSCLEAFSFIPHEFNHLINQRHKQLTFSFNKIRNRASL